MLIDCDTCTARGAACGGCVVNAVLQTRPEVPRLRTVETNAIEVLSRAGFEVTVLEGAEARRPGAAAQSPSGRRTPLAGVRLAG